MFSKVVVERDDEEKVQYRPSKAKAPIALKARIFLDEGLVSWKNIIYSPEKMEAWLEILLNRRVRKKLVKRVQGKCGLIQNNEVEVYGLSKLSEHKEIKIL